MVDSPQSANTLRKSAAIECTVFSAMAIGALLLGAPESAVSRHMTAARRTLATCAGLREQPAVSALILHGLANALMPPREGAEHNQQRHRQQRQQQQQQLMDDAQAVYEMLPEKDPLVNAFLTYRATNENLARFAVPTTDSIDPVNVNINISGGQDGGSGGGGGGGACTLRTNAAHPAYVVTDSEFPGLVGGE